jgi:phosphate transport system permease protein
MTAGSDDDGATVTTMSSPALSDANATTAQIPAVGARVGAPTQGDAHPASSVPTPRRLPTAIRPRDFGPTDGLLLVASALSSLALVWVVFYQLTLLSGAFGFLVCWYLVFLVLTWLSTAQVIEPQVATDRVVAVIAVTAGLVIVGLVAFIVLWVAFKAVPHIHWGSLFTKDQKHFEITDPQALNHNGIMQAIIGTLEQVAIATALGVPLAIATAVYLNEVRGKLARVVRVVVTAMSGTPSVVAGVFIYSMLILTHVLNYSGFAASLALMVILLPSVTRVVEEVLRIVPSGLREASMALGAPKWRTVWSVVLPTARSGVVTATLLGIARIVGETAPLIFTAFGSQVTNWNPAVHAQEALPLEIYDNVRQAQPVLITLAFEAAFVLMAIVLLLFVAARFFGRTKGKKSKRGGRAQTDDTLARLFVPVPMQQAPIEGEEFRT